MKYRVRVGADGPATDVEVEPGQVRMDGSTVAVRLTGIAGTPLYHLQLGDAAWTIAVESAGGDSWILGVEGERLRVEAASGRGAELAVRPRVERESGGAVRAPMPGLVVRVLVSEGQSVEAGASVVVVEAMKMENELRAALAGVVAKVHVAPGETVERGAVLVVIEGHVE